MTSWKDIEEIDLVELYAEENGLIASEEELSKRFDEEVLPGILEEFGEKGQAFEDYTRIRETFNNWTDSLWKEDGIHDAQHISYSYVGKFEN